MKRFLEEYSGVVVTCMISTMCLVCFSLFMNTDYGNVLLSSVSSPLQNQALMTKAQPVITAENRKIKRNEALNLMEGVSAVDGQGNNITSKVKAYAHVDVSTKGRYTVYYEVENSIGRKGYKTIYIIVD